VHPRGHRRPSSLGLAIRGRAEGASVEESEAFVEAYQVAAGRRWNVGEVETARAAGLWVYAFNAKKASLDGARWLDPGEAAERLRRGGA